MRKRKNKSIFGHSLYFHGKLIVTKERVVQVLIFCLVFNLLNLGREQVVGIFAGCPSGYLLVIPFLGLIIFNLAPFWFLLAARQQRKELSELYLAARIEETQSWRAGLFAIEAACLFVYLLLQILGFELVVRFLNNTCFGIYSTVVDPWCVGINGLVSCAALRLLELLCIDLLSFILLKQWTTYQAFLILAVLYTPPLFVDIPWWPFGVSCSRRWSFPGFGPKQAIWLLIILSLVFALQLGKKHIPQREERKE